MLGGHRNRRLSPRRFSFRHFALFSPFLRTPLQLSTGLQLSPHKFICITATPWPRHTPATPGSNGSCIATLHNYPLQLSCGLQPTQCTREVACSVLTPHVGCRAYALLPSQSALVNSVRPGQVRYSSLGQTRFEDGHCRLKPIYAQTGQAFELHERDPLARCQPYNTWLAKLEPLRVLGALDSVRLTDRPCGLAHPSHGKAWLSADTPCAHALCRRSQDWLRYLLSAYPICWRSRITRAGRGVHWRCGGHSQVSCFVR